MEGNSIPRKVLMTSDTVGGVWTYALELVRGLAPHGVKVALATMGALLTSDQWAEVRALENVQMFESSFRLEWMDDPWRDVEQAGEWLLEVEREFKPEVVHLNGYCHGQLPWTAPTIVVGHSCVLSWWFSVKNTAVPASWTRYRESVQRGLQAADLVVAPSHAMCEFLETYYRPLAKTAVIPNGRQGLSQRPPGKDNVVLAAGRLWDEAKNIEALAHVAHRLPWPVCLAGEARHPNGTVRRFDNVHLLGRLNGRAMADWYAHAAIYVLPARYEPFGLSALEAAGSGCALVLGDIGTLREIWGKAALFVHPNDEDGLAEAILTLINDRDLRAEYAHRAYEHARNYTPENMTNGYLRAYEQVMGCACEPAEICA
jgi:glycogen synthase